MITRLWLLTLLAAPLARGFDHAIDFDRCKDALKDTACFVRKSCITEVGTDDKVLEQFKDQTKGADCDVRMQIKMLNHWKLHVMMEVKLSGSNKIKLDDGLKLWQKDDQFVCKPGVQVSGATHFVFVDAGKQIFEDRHVFCSFIAELKNKNKKFELIAFYGDGLYDIKPKIVFTKGNVQDKVEYGATKEALWDVLYKLAACDYNKMLSSTEVSPMDASTVLKEVDTTITDFKCASLMIKMSSDTQPKPITKVLCHDSGNGNMIWKYDDSGIETLINGNFHIYCLEKLCQQCKNVHPTPLDNCPTCAQPQPAAIATPCPSLTCTKGKFSLTGTTVVEGAAECKKLPASGPTPAFGWFVGDAHLEKASCLELKECDKPAVTGDDKKITGLGTNSIKCADPSHDIRYSSGSVNETAKTLECNTLTGLFKGKDGKDVQKPLTIECKDIIIVDPPSNQPAAAGSRFLDDYGIPLGVVLAVIILCVLAGVVYCRYDWLKDKFGKKKPEVSAKKTEKAVAGAKSTSSATSITAPGETVDTSDGRKKSSKRSKRDSKKEKKEKKFKLEEHQTWDNETFVKKILPNFKTCEPEAKRLWLRDYLCRFYAYSNTKKTPESGTFNQFWLLVKQCCDDKCEDAGVWVELFNICFLIGYSVIEKNDQTDALRCHYMKPLECYMLEYLKKCDFYKRDNEPRSETEMRVICIMVLLHTRHPDVTETLRKLTFNEKQEVPLRMLTAACYTRERDDKGKTVQAQYKRVIDTSVLDPHTAEGWGTYLQHCAYGLGGYLITQTETFQYAFFDAIYQFPLQKEMNADRCFTPSDWLFAYKGAMLHENSAKVALGIFKQMNSGSLLHIEQLLKQQHKDDPDEIDKHRNQYKHDMKEYTQLLSELLIGEEEFKEFQPHLYFVLTFIGEKIAKKDEPLCEERIRERAINMYNMMRDRNFAKECTESLKAIGAKDV